MCPCSIVGDLNLPRVNWDMLTGPDDVLHQSFVDFVTNQGLSQLINFRTRGLNVLDILLTVADHIVTSVQCLPSFGGSDHATIDISLGFPSCPYGQNSCCGTNSK